MDSLKLRVLKELTARFEAVSISGGFGYNLAGRVYRGRSSYGDETEVPWVGVFELRPEEVLRAGETLQKEAWYVGVQGVVKSDPVHATDPAHDLMRDLKKVIGKIARSGSPHDRNPDHMLGGLLVDLQVDGGMTFVPPENQARALCALRLTITLVEDLENL